MAATSLATKLDIMLTEDADPTLVARTAQSMVKGGFLVCFQGLISTIGKEHVRSSLFCCSFFFPPTHPPPGLTH